MGPRADAAIRDAHRVVRLVRKLDARRGVVGHGLSKGSTGIRNSPIARSRSSVRFCCSRLEPTPITAPADSRVLSGGVSRGLVGVVALGFFFGLVGTNDLLGRLWSGWITKKADHHIDRYWSLRARSPSDLYRPHSVGPRDRNSAGHARCARWRRHHGLGFWIKARLEERFLREELGAEVYDSYRRRVPMLVPFGPKSA